MLYLMLISLKQLKQVRNEWSTALWFVSISPTVLPYLSGQCDRVEVMLRKCAALAKAKTKDGLTPLMWAANKGHVKVC